MKISRRKKKMMRRRIDHSVTLLLSKGSVLLFENEKTYRKYCRLRVKEIGLNELNPVGNAKYLQDFAAI